ncbi:MAG: hypothetical protein D6748_00055 [Calditrichaeota bacterium]|nr:MAG: hypothetical protein D6748_00055 [Calditrichota bacterium]
MRGGMMIRLIDVVLIILFGFLGISDIQIKRQIRMPRPSIEKNTPNENITYIFVRISPENSFSIEMKDQSIEQIESEEDLTEELMFMSSKLKKEGNVPVVIIDPHPDAFMQTTVDVFDICEKLQLNKSINLTLIAEADEK